MTVVQFQNYKSEKLVFKDQKRIKADPIVYGFYLLSILDIYSDHFWNNYQNVPEINESIANEFDNYILQLRNEINNQIRRLENSTLAYMLFVNFDNKENIVKQLEYIHDNLNFEDWFETIGIPIQNETKIIQFKPIKEQIKNI